MVILPIKFKFSSTTGADTQSFCSNNLATSLSPKLASKGCISVSINSLVFKEGSETRMLETGSDPMYLFSLETTKI